jgi:hypothetical protein
VQCRKNVGADFVKNVRAHLRLYTYFQVTGNVMKQFDFTIITRTLQILQFGGWDTKKLIITIRGVWTRNICFTVIGIQFLKDVNFHPDLEFMNFWFHRSVDKIDYPLN